MSSRRLIPALCALALSGCALLDGLAGGGDRADASPDLSAVDMAADQAPPDMAPDLAEDMLDMTPDLAEDMELDQAQDMGAAPFETLAACLASGCAAPSRCVHLAPQGAACLTPPQQIARCTAELPATRSAARPAAIALPDGSSLIAARLTDQTESAVVHRLDRTGLRSSAHSPVPGPFEPHVFVDVSDPGQPAQRFALLGLVEQGPDLALHAMLYTHGETPTLQALPIDSSVEGRPASTLIQSCAPGRVRAASILRSVQAGSGTPFTELILGLCHREGDQRYPALLRARFAQGRLTLLHEQPAFLHNDQPSPTLRIQDIASPFGPGVQQPNVAWVWLSEPDSPGSLGGYYQYNQVRAQDPGFARDGTATNHLYLTLSTGDASNFSGCQGFSTLGETRSLVEPPGFVVLPRDRDTNQQRFFIPGTSQGTNAAGQPEEVFTVGFGIRDYNAPAGGALWGVEAWTCAPLEGRTLADQALLGQDGYAALFGVAGEDGFSVVCQTLDEPTPTFLDLRLPSADRRYDPARLIVSEGLHVMGWWSRPNHSEQAGLFHAALDYDGVPYCR